MAGSPPPIDIAELLARVAIVLVEPKYPENIGAAARVAMNMGISRLILVRAEAPAREPMLKMATHKAAPLIEQMERHQSLAAAVAPFGFVVGTSARQGRHRHSFIPPRDLAGHLLPVLKNNDVALLFGPEHRGLTNEDLQLCNLTTTIPTADFSSLNLAQAVAIHCYELFEGVRHAAQSEQAFAPKLASSHEMEGMYGHLEEMLGAIDFLKSEDAYWMRNIRQFFGRLGLRSKEVRLIRGFCRQFLWHQQSRRTSR